MKLYTAVTPDQYELPLAVADSMKELAGILRVEKRTLYNKMYRETLGVELCGYAVRIVECGEEEHE